MAILTAVLGILTVTAGATAPAGAVSCAASPGDRIAVVIDFGDAPGAPDGVLATCVPHGQAVTNGMQALRAATGNRIGQDRSGKICQISGIPATFDPGNCSAPRDGTISYWAYFRGSGSGWTYSSVGAAGVRVAPTIVEGWRFVTVPASQHASSAPPPRNLPEGASYRWQSVCPAASPPATRPAGPAPSPPGSSGSGGGAVDPGGGGGSAAAPAAPTRDHGSDSGGSSASDRSARGPQGASTTTTRSGSNRTDRSSTTTSTTTTVEVDGTSGLRSNQTARRLDEQEVAAAAEASAGASRPLGAIVAGVGGTGAVVVALALVTRASRRRRARDDGEID